MADEDDILSRDDDSNAAAPPVVGLGLNSGTAGGGVMQGGSGMNLAAIAPAPLVGDTDDGGGDAALADRVEAIINDDGRFRAFASGLTFLVDEAGVVSLSGSVPSADMKRSLLASIHAVPGVAGVQENLTVGD